MVMNGCFNNVDKSCIVKYQVNFTTCQVICTCMIINSVHVVNAFVSDEILPDFQSLNMTVLK